MAFYEELSRYYDVVFPYNPTTYSFLSNRFKSTGKILDIATGTGNYAIAFAKDKFDVTAIDLDSEMIEALKKKSLNEIFKLDPKTMNMLDLNALNDDDYDGVFCIGNSLVHLQTIEDITTACEEIYKRLKVGGSLVVQIVNYDRIIEEDIRDLPLINNTDAGVKFIRKYALIDGMIHFKTRLIIKDTDIYDNSITLYPLRSKDFTKILEAIGFEDINLFGGFDGKAFDEHSFPLVVSAIKK